MTGAFLVLDATAVDALFDARPLVHRYWELADAGRLAMVLPAVAVAEVTARRQLNADAWAPMVLSPTVMIAPLTETIAIEIGRWPGDLAARHAIWEAHTMEGVIVTCDPAQYKPGDVPLLVV